MSCFLRVVVASAVSMSVLFAGTHAVAAAPARAIAMPMRQVPIHALRSTRPAVVRLGAIPVFAAMAAARHAALPEPVRALPLVVNPQPHAAFAAFLPRLGFAALLAAGGTRTCSTAHRRVPIEAVPAAPFGTADGCAARSFVDDERLPPTSLVAGHDKHALYGRAYTPSGDDIR